MKELKGFRAGVMAIVATAAILVSPWVVAEEVTAARKVLDARLQAFGSGSAEQLAQYKSRHEPAMDIDRELAFYRDTGGFDLLKVESSQENVITAVIRARDSDSIGRIELSVDPSNPSRVAGLRMFPTSDVPAEFMPARLPLPEVLAGVQAKAEAMAAQDRFAGGTGTPRNQRIADVSVRAGLGHPRTGTPRNQRIADVSVRNLRLSRGLRIVMLRP